MDSIVHEIHNSPYLFYTPFFPPADVHKVFNFGELPILENIATTSHIEQRSTQREYVGQNR